MDSTSNPYRFDIESISLRCRIHIETIMPSRYRYHMDSTSYRYRNDIKSISLRHRNDVIVSICIRHRNDNDFDIESISLRCQIHIDTITSLRYHNDIDTMSMPVSNPYRNNLVSM